METIRESEPYDYYDSRARVWYPGCATLVAQVAPDPDGDGWSWWVGEAVDALAGGRGKVYWEEAELRGRESSRRAAERRALAAYRECSR
jgi:hypothetical protein